MSPDEAIVVLKIMSGADGGCSHCVGNLYNDFLKHYPEYKELAVKTWLECNPYKDEDDVRARLSDD